MQFNEVPIRGMFFRGSDIVGLVDSFEGGEKLDLEREPDNEYDAYAVKALYDGVHIGYVAKEHASWIAPYMDEGATFSCTVTSMEAGNRGHLEPRCQIEQVPSEIEEIIEMALEAFPGAEVREITDIPEVDEDTPLGPWTGGIRRV